MHTSIKLYAMPFRSYRTYLVAVIFIAGNIVMPQLFHLLPQGGAAWLPIYFFTLVGAYLYGWRVGLLTAIASPIINNLLFGMPGNEMLPIILCKSMLLALIAGYVAFKFKRVDLGLIVMIVIGYQLLGSLGEWIINGNWGVACRDFRIGMPGIIFQILGGYFIIKLLVKSDIK